MAIFKRLTIVVSVVIGLLLLHMLVIGLEPANAFVLAIILWTLTWGAYVAASYVLQKR